MGPIRRALWLLLAIGALGTWPSRRAAAGEADSRDFGARDAVDALCELIDGVRRMRGPRPSVTALFRKILELPTDQVAALLGEAYEGARTERTYGAGRLDALDRIASFVYGVHPREDPSMLTRFGEPPDPKIEFGFVRIPAPGGMSYEGPLDDRPWRTFAELRGKSVPRTLPAPDVPAALDAIVAIDPDSGGDWNRGLDLARAVGEVARDDDRAFALVIEKYRARPATELFGIALAQTRRASAVEELSDAVSRAAAALTAAPSDDARLAVASAAATLRNASPGAALALARTLPEMARDAALRGIGGLPWWEVVIRRIDGARTAADRARWLREFGRVAWNFEEFPQGEALRPILESVLRWVESDDAAVADVGRVAAYEVLHNVFPETWSQNDFGPYDPAAELRRLVDDLSAGRILLAERLEPSVFERRPPELRWVDSGVRLTGCRSDTGVELTLTNAGASPATVDEVGLHYGATQLEDGTLQLRLAYSRTLALRIPAATLRTLRPSEVLTWALPLRAEHRTFRRLAVDTLRTIHVTGEPAAPYVADIPSTVVIDD